MIEARAVIQNEAGIHCRPSVILVREGVAYAGKIRVTAASGMCTLTSALEVLMLGLEKGAEVTIQVAGPDEGAFANKLADLFERHFDFPPC